MIATLREQAGFRRLWLAQTVLALGDACFRMGMLELFDQAGLKQDIETAKMFFLLSISGLVLGPFVMAQVDRWQRVRVLVFCDAMRLGLTLVMLAWLYPALERAAIPQSLWLVYGLILLSGILATYYLPTRYALLPQLVPAAKLVQANTLLSTSLAVLGVGGMPLGGWVAERFGPLVALGINGLAYAVSVILLRRVNAQPAAQTRRGGENLRAGIEYIRSHPTVLPFLLIAAAFAFLAGILLVTIIGYAQQTLHLSTIGLGWLGGVAGVGAALGVGLIGRAKTWTRSVWLPPLQLVLGGAALWLLSQTAHVWLAAPLILVLGAIGATAVIPIDVKLQEQVSETRRGAVFGARGIFTSATMIVAFWMKFGTDLLRSTPPPTVLMWCGVGAVLVALGTAWALRMRSQPVTDPALVLEQASGSPAAGEVVPPGPAG